MSGNNNRLLNFLKYIISAAIACVLLYFSFKEVSWPDFIAALKSCRWEFILLSMIASIFAFWLRGLRWREILLPIDPTTSRITTFNAINIGYIANFVFPRIGEFVRCGFITKNSQNIPHGPDSQEGVRKLASYDKVLGTVVLERSWDMITMFLFLIILLAFKWNEFGGFFVEKMWKPMQKYFNFSMWWIVLAICFSVVLLVWLVLATKDKWKPSGRLCEIFGGLMQGIGSCVKMKQTRNFFIQTALIWAMYWLMSAATMWALPDLDTLGIVDALFLMIAGSLGWLVPVPGGFGAFHFVVSLALSTIYGIPFELGIVFATLSHESQAITMALCGGGSYLYETFRK